MLFGPLRLAARLEQIKAQRLSKGQEASSVAEASEARRAEDRARGGDVGVVGASSKKQPQPCNVHGCDECSGAGSSHAVPYPLSRRRTKGSSVVVAEASLANRWDAEFSQPSSSRSRHHHSNRISAAAAGSSTLCLPLGSQPNSRSNSQYENIEKKSVDEKRVDGIGSSSLAAASAAHVERTRAKWKEDVSVSVSVRESREDKSKKR